MDTVCPHGEECRAKLVPISRGDPINWYVKEWMSMAPRSHESQKIQNFQLQRKTLLWSYNHIHTTTSHKYLCTCCFCLWTIHKHLLDVYHTYYLLVCVFPAELKSLKHNIVIHGWGPYAQYLWPASKERLEEAADAGLECCRCVDGWFVGCSGRWGWYGLVILVYIFVRLFWF